MNYTSTNGKNYKLWFSNIYLRGGKSAKVYYMLPENAHPNNTHGRSYEAAELPQTHYISELKNGEPIISKY